MSEAASPTPGPWRWEKSPADDYYEGPLDRLIGADGTEVMNFGSSTQYYPTEGLPPSDADGRLMAAAPRLLEACEMANRLLDNLMKAVPWGKTFDLDIALLNEVCLLLPKVIAEAKTAAP